MIDLKFNDREMMKELRAIDRALASLPEAMVATALRDASGKAMNPVAKEMRTALRKMEFGDGKRHGFLAKSIGRKARAVKSRKFAWVIIGPRSKTHVSEDGKKHNPALYGHLVERGRGPGGWHRGKVEGKNIIAPMWQRMKPRVQRDFIAHARPAIARTYKKAYKRAGGKAK